MKRLIVVAAVLLVSASPARSVPVAEWQSWFGGPAQQWANSVEPLRAGGYLVAGTHLVQPGNPASGGSESFLLGRADAAGKPLWLRQYRLGVMSWGGNAVEAADGGLVMTGTAHVQTNYVNSRIALMKTDPGGNPIWTRYYSANRPGSGDGTYGEHVQRTADGGFVILGSYRAPGSTAGTILLIRTDPAGNELWRSRPGDPLSNGSQVRQTADGGFAVCGSVSADENDYASYDLYLLKTGPTGARQWSVSLGTERYDSCGALRQTADGGFVLFGDTLDFGLEDTADYLLAKVDAAGNLEWQTAWGGAGDDWSGSVAEIEGGGFVTSGSARSAGGSGEAQVRMEATQLTAGGRKLSSIYLGESSGAGLPYAEGRCVEKTADGGFIVGGLMVANDWDTYLVKLAPLAADAPIEVVVDIKPGSDANPINLASKGTTPVAILGTPEFDPAQVDPATVTLAGAPVVTNRRGRPRVSFTDVDGDGIEDMLFHVATQRMALSEGDTSATLTGLMRDGTPIEGSDRVTLVRWQVGKIRIAR